MRARSKSQPARRMQALWMQEQLLRIAPPSTAADTDAVRRNAKESLARHATEKGHDDLIMYEMSWEGERKIWRQVRNVSIEWQALAAPDEKLGAFISSLLRTFLL